jgi:hypothetical protein
LYNGLRIIFTYGCTTDLPLPVIFLPKKLQTWVHDRFPIWKQLIAAGFWKQQVAAVAIYRFQSQID